MTKSQYEILLEELKSVLCFVSEKEIKQLLPQVGLFLIESNVFGEYEEIDEPDERQPTEILRGQLFQISDEKEQAKWYAILALYLAKEMEERSQQNDLKLANYVLHAINVSKAHFVESETRNKQLEKGIKEGRSREGTESNRKRYEPLDTLKNAAIDRFEPAIEALQLRRRLENKKTRENRVTYKNAAKIIYPEIAHLNKDNEGQKLIGRNGNPVGSLARILEELASKGELESTRER